MSDVDTFTTNGEMSGIFTSGTSKLLSATLYGDEGIETGYEAPQASFRAFAHSGRASTPVNTDAQKKQVFHYVAYNTGNESDYPASRYIRYDVPDPAPAAGTNGRTTKDAPGGWADTTITVTN